MSWTPGFDDVRAWLATVLGEGDLCLMMGAGDIDALGRSLVRSRRIRPARALSSRRVSDPPAGVQLHHPLARLTTIRTGGAAELFARVGSVAELERLLRWAAANGTEVGVVGSGSNLLIADEGVPGLVIKLDRRLSTIEPEYPRIVCGGGARLPAVSAAAANAGLRGIEFGVNIPGTVGGAVRMNANAYGGVLADVLEWVEVTDAPAARADGTRASSASPTAAPT